MRWFHLEKRLATATRWVALFGLFLLLFASLIIVGDVFARWLFHAHLAGTRDISTVILPLIVSTCFPIAVYQRQHVTIRFLGKALGKRWEAYLDFFGSVVLLVFLSLVAWQLVLHTADIQASGEHTWVLQIAMAPWWWIATAVVASCIPLQGFIVLSDLIRAMTGRWSKGTW